AAGHTKVVGVTNYGVELVATIADDNIFATQFHPEKSQTAGLTLLKNFLQWDGSTKESKNTC
ncbi:MAG: glutamine amidotransferase, partial [Pseudohongiellaceae bacterium]